MLLKKKIIPAMLGAFVSLGLVACGGDSTSTVGVGASTTSGTTGGTAGSGTTGDTPTGSTSSNAARTIVLSYPMTNSIENLEGGLYRRIGKAIVTDNEGNPVADGTEVYFSLIDSIIAKGTISSADGESIVANVLTDSNPTSADGVDTTLDAAYVIRNGAHQFIETGDHLFLKGDNPNGSYDENRLTNAEPEDKNRVISSLTANTITVSQNYSVDYPISTYNSGETDYIVGASLLGGLVQGVSIDDDDVEVLTNGYSTVKNGVATFHVTYPANVREINTGCIPSSIDARSLPLGSAEVVLVASAGSEAITVDDRFCMSPVAPVEIVLSREKHSVSPGESDTFTSTATMQDANEVFIPYAGISVFSTTDSNQIKVDDSGIVLYHYDENGDVVNIGSRMGRWGQVYIDVPYTVSEGAESGNKITVTVSSGDDSKTFTIEVI